MAAVAIVAILAAIGFPVYQGYVARSQTTAALAVAAGKDHDRNCCRGAAGGFPP
ncbi:hypothetical protein [Xanthomonas sacchari]|uniref:hypothetical protein n=1 Tax=Xanthomonas sacchari TaxID=56458 RepID=UPI003D189E35